MPEIIGTNLDEALTGSSSIDKIIGLAGNDTIEGAAGEDVIRGDFDTQNMLSGTDAASSFAEFGATGAWQIADNPDGSTSMSQNVQTAANATYTISFDIAANYGAQSLSGAVEVLWNGVVIDSFDTNSAVFSAHSVNFVGTGEVGELTFRTAESEAVDTGPIINTDGPAYWYEKDVAIDGQSVSVAAFAEGQTHVYQVLNGTLNVFDVESETYAKAGANSNVNINAIGFNQEDDLVYGIAVANGQDSLGNAVSSADLMMIDAEGNNYRLGSTPYRSWTADFDDNGNLWAFQSSMDRVTKIDVDQFDPNGDPIATTFKFPKEMITDQMWDVAYDATTQSFYGLVRPSSEGEPGKLYTIDISEVGNGGEPIFSSAPVAFTIIDDAIHMGMPAITFGALIIDSDGTLYAGGNGGDHDMNNATGTSGGIYRLEQNPNSGEYMLELVADAPKAYSNDGAMDPRASDPFKEKDTSAAVLIKSPSLTPAIDPDQSYDDDIHGGGGKDDLDGGFGTDQIVGASLGDEISGGIGDDALYGGAGPDVVNNGLISVYDESGLRFDQFGNPLPEDDDVLSGGDGDDLLDGSAGHDELYGGSGQDTMKGGSGSDALHGGDGDDIMSGGKQDDVMFGDSGNDVLEGGSGNDVVNGGIGDDTIKSGSGDDEVIGGQGNDVIDGGSGDDIVSGGNGNDRIKAGSGNDIVSGGDGNDYINAFKGDDVIDGGAGRDKIYAGAGADEITGGAASDTFVFRSEDLDGSKDIITDFTRSGGENDRLDLRALDLLEAGQTAADWIEQNVNQNESSVTVNIGSTSIVLQDNQGLGDAFLNEITDGFMF